MILFGIMSLYHCDCLYSKFHLFFTHTHTYVYIMKLYIYILIIYKILEANMVIFFIRMRIFFRWDEILRNSVSFEIGLKYILHLKLKWNEIRTKKKSYLYLCDERRINNKISSRPRYLINIIISKLFYWSQLFDFFLLISNFCSNFWT